MARGWRTGLTVLGLLAATAAIELAMGRLPLGPDHRFGWWSGNIWSSANSQRFADPYSISHVLHGLLFYFLLWLAARRLPARFRFLLAVVIEAAWEVAENSPWIINRYRAVTISLGYEGDSVLNSVSDILMMSGGFWLAWRFKPWMNVVLFLVLELVMLFWLRDNLTLNILMLTYPVQAIKAWQLAGAPVP